MNSYYLVISMLFIASWNSYAESRELEIQGVRFQANEVEYFSNSEVVHSFVVNSPTRFTFKNNHFLATSKVYLHPSGTISTIVSDDLQELVWQANKQDLPLDCGSIDTGMGYRRPRVVSFYPNQEYQRGCTLLKPTRFQTSMGEVLVKGNLDLNKSAELEYAQVVLSGILKLEAQDIALQDGSELAFHENGKIHFFTPKKGQVIYLKLNNEYGVVALDQTKDRPISMVFLPSGNIERAILGQELKHKELSLVLPRKTGVVFTELSSQATYLSTMIFSANYTFAAKGYDLKISQLSWDKEKGYIDVIVAEPFFFVHPENGKFIEVTIGSIVGINEQTKEIIGIRIKGVERESSENTPSLPEVPRF